MLNQIYHHSSEMTDQVLMGQLLEIAAYILNSMHYYQKFKLRCDLLHPLDLLLVIERVKRDRKKDPSDARYQSSNFDAEAEGIIRALNAAEAQEE